MLQIHEVFTALGRANSHNEKAKAFPGKEDILYENKGNIIL